MMKQKNETSFSKTRKATKWEEYKYTLAKHLSELSTEEKNEVISNIATSLNISERMVQNYIYAKRKERSATLTKERILIVSKVTGIPIEDFRTPTLLGILQEE